MEMEILYMDIYHGAKVAEKKMLKTAALFLVIEK